MLDSDLCAMAEQAPALARELLAPQVLPDLARELLLSRRAPVPGQSPVERSVERRIERRADMSTRHRSRRQRRPASIMRSAVPSFFASLADRTKNAVHWISMVLARTLLSPNPYLAFALRASLLLPLAILPVPLSPVPPTPDRRKAQAGAWISISFPPVLLESAVES